ncbi:unnamed protein product [Sphagnum balticum]
MQFLPPPRIILVGFRVRVDEEEAKLSRDRKFAIENPEIHKSTWVGSRALAHCSCTPEAARSLLHREKLKQVPMEQSGNFADRWCHTKNNPVGTTITMYHHVPSSCTHHIMNWTPRPL